MGADIFKPWMFIHKHIFNEGPFGFNNHEANLPFNSSMLYTPVFNVAADAFPTNLLYELINGCGTEYTLVCNRV